MDDPRSSRCIRACVRACVRLQAHVCTCTHFRCRLIDAGRAAHTHRVNLRSVERFAASSSCSFFLTVPHLSLSHSSVPARTTRIVRTVSAASFLPAFPHSFRPQINVINCIRPRYRMSIRGGTIDDNHLTGERDGAYAVISARPEKQIREKRRALKAGEAVLSAVDVDFFPPPEIPADLRRVDRKFVPILKTGQIDVRCTTKVSPFLSRKRALKSTVNHDRLPTTVRGKSSWIDTSRFSKRRTLCPQKSHDNC